MARRLFASKMAVGSGLPTFAESDIKAEPMMFSASFHYAQEFGGPLTASFLRALPSQWTGDPSFILDSRTHMLMPGWFPCIPGWHLDDVPRTRPDGQPDHISPIYQSEHVMALWGTASVTTFMEGHIELTEPPAGDSIYGAWHHVIEEAVRQGHVVETPVPDRRLVFFDWQSFHRGNPATKNGWRFFIRASCNTQRKHFNEIRSQVQVYLPAVNAGW